MKEVIDRIELLEIALHHPDMTFEGTQQAIKALDKIMSGDEFFTEIPEFKMFKGYDFNLKLGEI